MDSKQPALSQEYVELEERLQDPAIFSTKEYPKLARRKDQLEKLLALFADKKSQQEAIKFAQDNLGDPEMGELAQLEIEEMTPKLAETMAKLEEALTPKDPNDEKDAIIEIRAAAGGDEASLFAGELYRMYIRWCEMHGLNAELISETSSEAGGFKEVIFAVRGEETYGKLKFEAGVHRVQRVPVTESQGRIHTSTVTVAVLPEAEESDIEIRPQDLRIDVYHASGHGGQSVNTTDSAVRITHLPTGVVVTQQDEKSQTKNKLKAMGVLRSRLLQAQIEAEQQKLSDSRKKLIGSGDRSEKIRTYNFPQDRITDHRIGYSRSNIPVAMTGDIDDMIDELHKAEHDLLATES
jgi:peptide chain release factor 1